MAELAHIRDTRLLRGSHCVTFAAGDSLTGVSAHHRAVATQMTGRTR